MSDGDLAVKFFILWRFLPICGVIFILSLMRRKRKKVIAMLIYYLQGPMNRATAPQKRQLFRDLKYAKGSLKILEIGAGAGANFQFYHSRTKVTCLEPNEEFKAYILQNGVKTGLSIENITMVRGYAENMDMLAADSFDAVVCTFVLCSVRSPSLVLQEVKRVLKPVCFYHLTCLCNKNVLSALVGCWSSAFIRGIIYKFLNVCPFDYTFLRLVGRLGSRKPVKPHQLGGYRYPNWLS